MNIDNTFSFLSGMLNDLISFLPNFFGSMIVLFVGWLIARVLRKLVTKLLKKTSIDKLADKLNEIDFVAKSKVDIAFSKLIANIVYYFVFFVFVAASIDVLGVEALSELLKQFIGYIPNILVAFVILIAGLLLAELVRKALNTALESFGIPSGKLIANFVFYFLLLNIVVIALEQAKINTAFLASNISYIFAGGIFAFALGYGLAAKNTLANFLAGQYAKDKVKVGDVVRIGDAVGTVVEKNNNSITLQGQQQKTIIPLNRLIREDIIFIEQ